MKKIKYLLLPVVLVAAMIMGATMAFAEDVPQGNNTATLTVSGLPAEVHKGDTVTLNITVATTSEAKIGGTTGKNITTQGLEYVSSTGASSATAFSAAKADGEEVESFTWEYTYKVTADIGESVSINVGTIQANEIGANNYAYFRVTNNGNASAKVVAAETEPSVSKDALTAAINDAKAKLVDESKYTDETVAALKTALAAAEQIAAKADASQTEVDEAKDALTAAMNGLKAKPAAEPSNPTDPGSTEKDDVPKTGDESLPMWPFVVLMVVSGTAAVVILRKKASVKCE